MRDYSYYIDRAKEMQGFKYDIQVDQAIGFKGSMTTLLRKGKRHLSDDAMYKLAKLAKIDPAIGLIDLNIWKASSNETREIMEGILQKLPQIACLLMAVGIVFTSSTSPSSAMSNLSSDKSGEYIVWK